MSRSIQTPISDLRHIRSLMERSRYFIGLSGLSGVGAGVFGLVGVGFILAYQWAAGQDIGMVAQHLPAAAHPWGIAPLPFLFLTGSITLLGALGCGWYFTRRRVRKLGHQLLDEKTYKLLLNLALPLVAGGVFCLALIYHGIGGLIGPTTLIFYGLALINGSSFVSEELRALGYMELVLGLVSLFFLGYGLYCWGVGFGLLHIGYGLWMYRNYDAHE